MSKYDFELDLSQNTSTGILLSKIEQRAVVLEFGCANGRMTRYMKTALNCQVYIVEYDQEAYDAAKEYAVDGLCDDILNFRWVDQFAAIKFDAILFADVLEHLAKPEQVLRQAAGLLKETGSIYISVPNITHNDIILKACEEHFDYTPTGLLDYTHIHFWGLKNIEQLPETCGLSLRSVEGTYCPTGFTEQYQQRGGNGNRLLENILKERRCGEVYQYIIVLDKRGGSAVRCSFKQPSIPGYIYLNPSQDLSKAEGLVFEYEYQEDGSYLAHCVLDDTNYIEQICIDPVLGQGCLINRLSVCQGGKELPLIYRNAIVLAGGVQLFRPESCVFVDLLPGTGSVIVDAEIVIPGVRYIDVLQAACVEQHQKNEHLQRELNGYRNLLVVRAELFARRVLKAAKRKLGKA